MRPLSRFAAAALIALLTMGSISSAVDARPYPRWDHPRWDRRDHFDAGDLIVAAIIVGGIAVLASAAKDASRNNGTIFGGKDGDRRGKDTMESAVEACSAAAEDRAAESGREARVAEIGGTERDGDRYRVRGTVEFRPSSGWEKDRSDRDRSSRDWRDSSRFTCTYSYGQVEAVWLDNGFAGN